MDDRIEKRIELKAPVSRVWRALTDYREFGEWFRVKLEGPFVAGPGFAWPDHLSWLRARQMGGRRAEDGARTALFLHLASLCRRSQNRLLEGDAHARRIQAGEDHERHTACCSRSPASTRFPATAALEAFRMNDGGWTEQMKNIEKHVAANAVAAWPPNGRLVHRYLPRWATRRGYRWWRSSAAGGLVRSLS